MGEIIWSPTEDYIERANVTRLMRANGIRSYDELIERSQGDIEWFWDAVVKDLGLEFYDPYRQVLDESAGPPWARWFVGGTVNVAFNCVDRWADRTPDKAAILWEGEEGAVRRMSYRELQQVTNRLANGLRTLGVGMGDRVGIFMPLTPESAAATLACAKLGAIYLPIFSGFGAQAVASRLQDAEAKVLITADGFTRRASVVPMKETADEALAMCPSVEHVVVWPRLGRGDAPHTPGRDVHWDELLEGQGDEFETEPLDPEHPLLLAYTSGTTGKPKGAVHVHGGFLVKVCAEVAYEADLHPDETLFWVSDLGWVMGPWQIIGAGALGSTVFLFDGAPDYPEPDRIWDMVERHRITTLGISPTLIRTLIPAGTEHVKRHDLSSLRILGSAGEPWNPESYRWYFDNVGGRRCPIINMSGGTEVLGFLSPLPITDLKPCTLRGPALGMDVDIWDENGQPVRLGELGELVCKKPSPAMTRGIWRDPQRYLDTYWSRWPDVWVHGDWASRDDDGFWFLHGRSDDTLKVAGKRLGPAEVESALSGHPAVVESAAVGVPDPIKGEAIWCFVVIKPPFGPSRALGNELAGIVATEVGKSFRPSRIEFVDDLPRTRSAKILRRAIRAIVSGTDPGDLSSLENPGALDTIRETLATARGTTPPTAAERGPHQR